MQDITQAKDKVRLKGTIRRILFPRPVTADTDFMIAILVGNGDIEITIKGAMYGIHEKDEILIEGEWVNDKKYGMQLQVTGWERPIPTTKNQAIDLLSSSLIKGCGPKTAKLIVEVLGDGAIETILQQKEDCLYSVKGISQKNAAKIVESLSNNFNVQNIIKHLSQYGVTVKMAIKLHKVHGGNAVPIVQANPYELANLSMVGFDQADAIALNMGVAEDSQFRCQAAVLNMMRKYDGHCYTEKDEIMRDSLASLNKRSKILLRESDVDSALYYLHKAQKIVNDSGRIYLKSIYEHERTAARRIAELVTAKGPVVPKARIAHEIIKYQTKNRIILNAKQQEAIYQLFESNILVLTGGPGTGKCVSRGTLVLTNRGIVPIESLAPTARLPEDSVEDLDITVQGRFSRTNTSHFYNGGIKKTIKVKTKAGFDIEGTPNHRIICMTEDGPDWKRLDQITALDYIAIHRGTELWGKNTSNQKDIEIAYLLGLFIGDGGRGGKGIKLSNPEEEILYWVRNILKLLYNYEVRVHHYGNRCPYICVYRQDVVNDFVSRGYCQSALAADKVVPNSIMQGSREEAIAFVQGLFDTDGHSSIRDGYIEWITKSVQLAAQVQILLANLGIIAKQRIKTVFYEEEPRNFVCTTISGNDARLFYEKVGFRLQRKQLNQNKLPAKSNTNLDVIPLMGKKIREFLAKTGSHSRKFWWKWKRECKGERNPSRERLQELFASFKETATADKSLLEACNPNLYWDQIGVISYGKSEVYDLTVPSEESFVANGFVNHNTAVIKAASHIYQQFFPADSKALCAPTGRASQHLAKTSGMKAKTVHRLLNWGVKTKGEGENSPPKAKKDELNPLSEELIIPDEWSMADIELASSLHRAVPSKGKILFVGDPDQLPSVGPGAVLRDMINSKVVPVVHLDEIYRQAKNSLITENAHRINRGEMIQTVQGRKDFIFLERPDAESVQTTILTCVKRLLGIGYKIEDILVLSPMKKGTAGVIALDEAVKALVNPVNRHKKELTIGNKSFRVGDIIIQNQKNSVDKDLYNGNIGIVKAICLDPTDEENKEEGLLCDIWGNEVFLSREDISEFDFTTGYCITTHKSQGGQAKVVIAPVITNHYVMLTRNILYTAMTRAEEMMILVGQKKAVAMAIANTTPNLRRTFLSERIRTFVEEKKKSAVNMELFG